MYTHKCKCLKHCVSRVYKSSNCKCKSVSDGVIGVLIWLGAPATRKRATLSSCCTSTVRGQFYTSLSFSAKCFVFVFAFFLAWLPCIGRRIALAQLITLMAMAATAIRIARCLVIVNHVVVLVHSYGSLFELGTNGKVIPFSSRYPPINCIPSSKMLVSRRPE